MKTETKQSEKFIKELKGILRLSKAESISNCAWESSSKAQHIVANDNILYIVKFKNNPQSTRVLANEIIANSIAKLINIPIPEFSIINIDDKLVKYINIVNNVNFNSGNQFASKYTPNNFVHEDNFDKIKETKNYKDWTKVIIFETLIQNIDFRQRNVLFYIDKKDREHKFCVIDHGYAFKNQKWSEINFKSIDTLLNFNSIIDVNKTKVNKKKKINTIFNEIIDTFKINDENIKKIINIPVLEEWGIDSKDKTVIADYITDFNKNTKKIINMIRK